MDKKKHTEHDHTTPAGNTPQPQVEPAAEPVEAEETAAAGDERLKQLEESLAAKEVEAAANWDKFVRERADLENYRRRVQKEKEELLKYGNEALILEILPVLDNMERALAHSDEESQNAVVEGVRMTHTMLLGALKKFGVSPIDTGRGTAFDPAFHQAMCQVESDDLPPNVVVEEFQKGYLLNERLLRPAMVSVTKG